MTAPYKKRAKSGYNTDKASSNRAERTYSEVEINSQLTHESKVGAKAAKQKISKIETELRPHISKLKRATNVSGGCGLEGLTKKAQNRDSFFSSYYNELYRDAKKAIPVLQEHQNHPDLPSKVKKLIKELLDKA